MRLRSKETASDGLFRILSEEIISGRLKSEEKISEPEIARRFGTSRAPVREAIRRLEERGLVNRKPRSGPSVASFSMRNFLEMFDIREALEGVACRLAAENMSDAELVQLRRVLEKHEIHLRQKPDLKGQDEGRDFDFHYLIARGSKNAALIKLLCEDYYNLIKLYRRRFRWIGTERAGAQTIKEHFRILEVLEERDGAFAEITMRRHIASTRSRIKKNYQKMKTE